MQPLPRPSVSPLYSFCSVPTHRAPSFSAALRSIMAWLTGYQPEVSKSEKQLEARLVDLLAEELAENESPADQVAKNLATSATSLIDRPPIAPKRPRRLTGREDR
jgi:hypothetical protein